MNLVQTVLQIHVLCSQVALLHRTMQLYLRVMCPKDAEGIANNVDPDQTAPLGAV